LSRVGIGIIGLGGISTWGHLPGYLDIPRECRVVAMCDKVPESVESKATLYNARAYTDYEKLLQDPEVEAVDIVLPHYLHAKVALAAIEAGKHVLVEKPFTTTVEEADSVITAAKDRGVKLMVAENTRFVDAYIVARKLLDRKVIGEICFVRTYIGGSEMPRLRDPKNWRGKAATAGGGVLLDAGVHSFYLVQWMVGAIRAVQASTTNFLPDLPIDVEDNATGTLKFENGALGNFSLTDTTEAPWTEILELYGVNGSLKVDMLSERPLQIYSTKGKAIDPSDWWSSYGELGWSEPFIRHSAFEWKTNSIRREVQEFVRYVAQGQVAPVSGEDGRRAVKVALRAYESVRLGREVSI
jgi:UDP-N-acetylglucosamine 3-dehydrogenase